MITYALTIKRSQVAACVFLLAGLLLVSLNTFAAEQTRLSVTSQGTRVDRDNGDPGIRTEDEFPSLREDGDRLIGKTPMVLSKPGAATAQAPNTDFWFYTADVELFNDHDGDGYFHGIDLLFDADTWYTFADVYAVVYLSLDGGPWNEYAVTEDFTLYGASSEDEYIIVTELVSGYPAGSYDVLIELFDAYDNTFLAWFGPEDTSELAFLPLEDADRDAAVIPEVIVVNRHHGGGSTGLLAILILGLLAVGRFRAARSA
jgi:hypothetical protein